MPALSRAEQRLEQHLIARIDLLRAEFDGVTADRAGGKWSPRAVQRLVKLARGITAGCGKLRRLHAAASKHTARRPR